MVFSEVILAHAYKNSKGISKGVNYMPRASSNHLPKTQTDVITTVYIPITPCSDS
jgi:hypothetical protein